jgi:hypothetical protein
MPLSQTQLLAFNAITGFVKDLNSEFGQRQHSLALYSRLIEHMNLSQETAINRVVEGFISFIGKNQSAIESRNTEGLTADKVSYSDRVYLTLKPLFAQADAETKEVMWRHLLTIYGLLYPDSQAKEILRKMNSEVKSAETAMISDMVQKIVPHLNPDETNPMQAIMGLMSSGVFTELIGTMQKGMDDGSVNMNSLLGQVTSMFAQPDPTARLITSASTGGSGGDEIVEEK